LAKLLLYLAAAKPQISFERVTLPRTTFAAAGHHGAGTRCILACTYACSRVITYMLKPSIYFLEHPPAHGKYLKYRTLNTANIRMCFFTGINTLKRTSDETFILKVVSFIQKDFPPEGHSLYFKRLSSERKLPSKMKVIRFILKRSSKRSYASFQKKNEGIAKCQMPQNYKGLTFP
jgi:hypothetical protein